MVQTVSLIIPAYNCSATIDRAVRSGLQQSHLEEIIIVDDCSTDSTYEVALGIASTSSRVGVMRTLVNSGPGASRNMGAHAATATYVSFLDSDDELLGDFFNDAVFLLMSMPQASAAKSDQEYFDPVKGYLLPAFDPRYSAATLSSSVGMVIKRDIFAAIGGYPEGSEFRGPLGGEDVAFMQALIEHFQPIGKTGRVAYRVWSKHGSHVDKFLSNTRLTEDGFEFVRQQSHQTGDDALEVAVANYLAAVSERLRVASSNG